MENTGINLHWTSGWNDNTMYMSIAYKTKKEADSKMESHFNNKVFQVMNQKFIIKVHPSHYNYVDKIRIFSYKITKELTK
jgi:hypothetical protein